MLLARIHQLGIAHGLADAAATVLERESAACDVDAALEIGRHAHRPETVHAGAPGVADGHPEPGLQEGPGNAPRLAEGLACHVVAQRPAEHGPMDTDMLDRGSLTEDMGALEMAEGRTEFAARLALGGGFELLFDEGADAPGRSEVRGSSCELLQRPLG